MRSFPYLPGLLFIFWLRSLVLFQSSVCFVNTSLFSSVKAKIKYLLLTNNIIFNVQELHTTNYKLTY